MKFGRLFSLFLCAILFIPAIPGVATESPATREYVIHHFIRIADQPYEFSEGDYLSSFVDQNRIAPAYRKSLALAVKNKMVGGYEDQTLRPNAPVLRVEALALLGRAIPPTAELKEPEILFNDVPDWAKSDVSKLTRLGLVKGYGNGLVGANDEITREQVHILANRLKAFYPVRPQDDFYQYVNQNWIANKHNMRGSMIYSYLDESSYEVYDRKVAILQEILNKKDFNKVEEEIRILYNSYANESRRDEFGINALYPFTDTIRSAQKFYELTAALSKALKEAGCAGLFQWGIAPQVESVFSYQTMISPSPLLLPRDSYEESGTVKDHAVAFIAKVLQYAKYPLNEAMNYAEQIYHLEKECATLYQYPDVYEQEPLKQSISPYDTELFQKFNFSDFHLLKGLHITKELHVLQPEVLKKIFSMFQEENIELIKAYSIYQLVMEYREEGPASLLREYDKIDALIFKELEPLSLDNRALNKVLQLKDDYFEKAYLLQHEDKELQKDVRNLTDGLIKTYKKQINSSGWVSKAYQNQALKRLDYIHVLISNDYTKDDLYLPKTLTTGQPVKEDRFSLIQNRLSMEKNRIQFYSDIVREDLQRGVRTFALPSLDTRTYLDTALNVLTIPEGVLTPSLWDKTALTEDRLGTMGYLLAEELTNTILFRGTWYDHERTYGSILTDYDKGRLKTIDERIISLYNTIDVQTELSFDAKKTRHQAHSAMMALQCILEYAKGENMDLERVIEAFAKGAREKYTENVYKLFPENDYLPAKAKVNVSLMNSPLFQELYHVEEGDGMYLPTSSQIKVW